MNDTTRELLKVARHDNTLTNAERQALVRLLNGDANAVPTPAARILRRREVAARLSCTVRSIDRWCALGILPRVKLPGFSRASGIPESAVIALIATGAPSENGGVA